MPKTPWFCLAALAGALGCQPYTIGAADPNEQLARARHVDFVRSADRGFGLDPSSNILYESFDVNGLTDWTPEPAGSPNAGGDAWFLSTKHSYFGKQSLTYGTRSGTTSESSGIAQPAAFGQVTLTRKKPESLAKSKNPVLMLFSGFEVAGSPDDKTAWEVQASSDLGFTWDPLVPDGESTSSIEAPAKTPSEGSFWQRRDFALARYKGGAILLRLTLSAGASSLKRPFLDDILIVERPAS